MSESSPEKKYQKKIQTAEDLMQRVANGDRHAFTTLVQVHQNSILNFIWRLMGDKTHAEDLSQDVFLRVWKSAPKYEKRAKFSTWIYRIAINLCLNKKRTLKIKNMFLTSLPLKRQPQINTDFTTPENQLLKAEQTRRIFDILNTLPSAQRIAVTLKFYQGLSYAEISQILDRSIPAVDALLVRAKKNIQKKIRK
ncbi:MAG: sigma-70 family RNA polymerase sigma factor [Deltaproteobacteria bacterium]|jgi:RNA polymerase sigma-70 factor (ECF subfamily)|nr:sigma-70 family RNA polymerase sigma factor [Deltaproteobacteria bacterium]